MDFADQLAAITTKCHLVMSADQAVHVAPDLCVDAPSIWSLGEEGAAAGCRWAYPVACTTVLAQPVADVVAKALSAALDDQERESFTGLGATDWAADPLTAALARLLLEASLVSNQATGLPMLELARIASGMLAGTPPAGTGRGPSATAIERGVQQLQEQLPVRQGEILSQVAWSLSARISAAWGLACQASSTLRPTRFYQAMMRSKLCLVYRSELGLPELALLLGALDVPADPVLLGKLIQVCETGLGELDARLRDGKAKPKDRQFSAGVISRACVGAGSEGYARRLAHDPDVAVGFLLQLSDFFSVKQLEKQGIDRKQAKLLMDPELAQAVAASLGDALRAMQLWDLLGAMVALVQRSDDIQVPSWQKGFRSRLVVPRGDLGDTKAFVLAARLGDVQAKTYQEARTNDDALVPLALESRYAALQTELELLGAAVYTTGTHLVGLLPSATAALNVAEKLLETATPPFGLEFGPLRQPTTIPRGPAIGVGLAYGSIHGGFDGQGHALRGPAIAQALGLTGFDSPHGALGDPLGVRHVALGAAGLLSKGMVASPIFVEQLEGESNRQGRRFQLPDAGQPVAGVRKPFVAYPVAGVREGNDRTVTLLLRLDGDDKDSPVEIIRMGIDSFQEFHSHEQGLAPGSCRGLSAGGAGIYPPSPPATQAASPAPHQAPALTSSMLSDPFGSETSSTPSLEGSDFDFDVDDDGDGEEYEFEIEEVPFSPPAVQEDEFEEDDAFALDDLEVVDFDEGVLVLDDKAVSESPEHPLDSLDLGEEVELGDGADDSSPFAFDSDNAFSSDGMESSPGEDLFSFEELEDDEDDPFTPATSSAPAAISLSGETSLDAWDTSPQRDEISDPSVAGAQTEDEALLGFLPPAEPDAQPENDRPSDEPIPLGYLPPAPDDEPGERAEIHEVKLPARLARRAQANPTLMPEDPAPAPSPRPPAPAPGDAPGSASDAAPAMPSFMMDLLDEGRDDSPAPGDSSGPSAFQFVQADEHPPAAVTREDQAHTPPPPAGRVTSPAHELEIPSIDPGPAHQQPAAPDKDDDQEPSSEATSADSAQAFPTDPASPFAPPPSDDELSDDPLADGDDDDAFEALFASDDDDDDDIDFAGILDEALGEGDPSASSSEPAPGVHPPAEAEQDRELAAEQEFVQEAEPEMELEIEQQAEVEQDSEAELGSDLTDDLAAVDGNDDDDSDPFDFSDPELPSEEPPVPAKPQRGADGAKKVRAGTRSRTMPDFGFMFTGYHIYITEKNSVLFGHRYGAHLLDVHEYPCGDDVPEAYLRFLKDKVSERFVPRSDLSRPVPKHLEGSLLDVSLLQGAFTILNEG